MLHDSNHLANRASNHSNPSSHAHADILHQGQEHQENRECQERQDRQDRIGRLQTLLRTKGLDGFLLTHNVDLYYLTGSMQTGYAFIPCEGEPIFFVKRSITRAQQEAVIRVEPLGSFRQFADTLAYHYPDMQQREQCAQPEHLDQPCQSEESSQPEQPVIASEYDVLPVQQWERLRKVLPHVRWTDGSTLLRELRMVKSPSEIERIRTAAAAAKLAVEEAVRHIRVGMTELAFIAHIEHTLRLQGHIGMMRMRGYNQEIITGMVAAGAAAAEPTYFDGPAGGRGLTPASPQGASCHTIAANEPILVDIGCCIDGYVIDQTRTLVIGQLDEDLQRAYDVASSILRATEAALKPGTSCESLYEHALNMAAEAGLSAHFMGYGADQVKFLGHGIGMEIDEWPVLARGFTQTLQPGMVIAVEPKFTFPGRGVVGIEDTYVITDDGCEKLTMAPDGLYTITSVTDEHD
ncbi:M24 family metallopeptidase [Paenibacillus sp. 481]|uniref:M24 family metallopeptidase n=1 Tax=Paenibacillus sp. 481 TaxID=2835869 RepID=UPI001E3A088E|nr:Xaa-Pro peptidase family protein [Paenibacillus sp. 481]UHA74745.1 aminopeptidase P family protein [Paenibacillus sp. 481]